MTESTTTSNAPVRLVPPPEFHAGHWLCTLPTGSGKTHHARVQAQATASDGLITLVIVPLRALAQEIAAGWQPHFAGPVRAYTRDTTRPGPYRTAQVIVTTPERLDLITRNWRRHHAWLARVGLTVIDEVHLMGTDRGARLDAALTRLRALCPLTRLMALSATVGDPGTLAAWLGARHWHDDRRTVPLSWHGHPVRRRRPRDRYDALLSVLGDAGGDATLVFVNSRARATDLALALTEDGFPAAVHHAGLTAEQRHATETAFRAGTVRTLISTGTLEMGVNLPSARVILHDLTRFEDGRAVPDSHVTVHQRAGRAGRDGAAQEAHVHLIGTPEELDRAYETPSFEPLRSPLGNELNIQDFVLGCVDAGMARSVVQARRLVSQSFAAFTGALDAETAVQELLNVGAIEDDAGRLRVTDLGRVASRHLLPPRAVAHGRSLSGMLSRLSVFDVLCHAAQVTAEHLGVWRPTPGRDGQADAVCSAVVDTVPSVLLDEGPRPSWPDMHAAALLLSACDVGDAEAAAVEGTHAPNVTALREGTARIVTAWAEDQGAPRLRLIAAMLHAEVPFEVASLTLLSGVGGKTARLLAAHGITDIEDVAARTPAELTVPGVRAARAARWVTQAEALVKTFEASVTWDPAPPTEPRSLMGPSAKLPCGVDPRRLLRALHLTATPGENGAFDVTGGEGTWTLTAQDTGWVCPCPDRARGRTCKHELAVLLFTGDAATRRAAREIGGLTYDLALCSWPSTTC